MTIGVVAGWFLPVLAMLILTANVATFPLLLILWRARGVVPRSGRLAGSRYWRIAPILVIVAVVTGFFALALWPEQRIVLWLAVVLSFTVEHLFRLSAWSKR